MAPDARLALTGNPNSGKTTLFNAITGSRQRVGNYPGITVERKEGSVTVGSSLVEVLDLPGTYSLTAYTMEELVARQVLVEERPDVVVDVLDATVLERSLYLAVQIMELGVPLVLALNMMDEVRKKGMTIDSKKLASLLQVPVVETIGRAGQGKDQLLRQAVGYAAERAGQWRPLEISYGPDLDAAIQEMSADIDASKMLTERFPARWTAIKYLEGDENVIALGQAANEKLSKELQATALRLDRHCRATLDAEPAAVIADHRYGYIASILRQGVAKRDELTERINFSDKLDALLTHKVAGPLIMLLIIYGMFTATFFIGKFPADGLEAAFKALGAWVEGVMAEGPLRSLLVSGVIEGLGGVLSFVPYILIMFVFIAFLEDLGYMARMAYMLDRVFRIFGLHGCSVMPLVISGGIAGGCAVPGIMATRTLRSPKEKLATVLTAPFLNCGAKLPVFLLLTAAFFPTHQPMIMFGITIFAWAVALIIARILRWTLIRGESTPFVMELPPYRLPTLRGIVLHTLERLWEYLKKAGTILLAVSILVWAAMTYPGLSNKQVEQFAAERAAVEAQIAVEKAAPQRGTIPATPAEPGGAAADLKVSTDGDDQSGETAEKAKDERLEAIDVAESQAKLRSSLAGRLGVALEPVSRLAGFDWRANIALLAGTAAKEVIVSTLGTAYSMGAVDPENAQTLSERLAEDPALTPSAALALMVFVLLYSPCVATIAVIIREAGWQWAVFSTGFNTALAFSLAVVVYQIGRLF